MNDYQMMVAVGEEQFWDEMEMRILLIKIIVLQRMWNVQNLVFSTDTKMIDTSFSRRKKVGSDAD